MKKNKFYPQLMRLTFVAIIVAFFVYLYRLLRATPLLKIKEMFIEFEKRRGGIRKFEDSGTICELNQLLKSDYCFAVFTYHQGLSIPYGITLAGSSDFDFDPQILDAATRERYYALVTQLRSAGIPFGLKDYPLTIRIGVDRLRIIKDNTGCNNLLLFPCIEGGWPHDPGVPAERNDHLTVGILGADPNEPRKINDRHWNGVDGEETWPYRDYSWFKYLP